MKIQNKVLTFLSVIVMCVFILQSCSNEPKQSIKQDSIGLPSFPSLKGIDPTVSQAHFDLLKRLSVTNTKASSYEGYWVYTVLHKDRTLSGKNIHIKVDKNGKYIGKIKDEEFNPNEVIALTYLKLGKSASNDSKETNSALDRRSNSIKDLQVNNNELTWTTEPFNDPAVASTLVWRYKAKYLPEKDVLYGKVTTGYLRPTKEGFDQFLKREKTIETKYIPCGDIVFKATRISEQEYKKFTDPKFTSTLIPNYPVVQLLDNPKDWEALGYSPNEAKERADSEGFRLALFVSQHNSLH